MSFSFAEHYDHGNKSRYISTPEVFQVQAAAYRLRLAARNHTP